MSEAPADQPQTPQSPADAELADALRSIRGVGESAHGSTSIDDLDPEGSDEADAPGSD